VAKEPVEVITRCPNPKCGKPIYADHINSWCIECGEPLPDDVQEQIPRLRALRARASGVRSTLNDPSTGKLSDDERAEVIFLAVPFLGLWVAGIIGLLVAFIALLSREYLAAGVSVIGTASAFGCFLALRKRQEPSPNSSEPYSAAPRETVPTSGEAGP
jgi:hypothetical protein